MVKRPKTPPFHGGNRGSNPLGVTKYGPLAQLVRAVGSYPIGPGFESLKAHRMAR